MRPYDFITDSVESATCLVAFTKGSQDAKLTDKHIKHALVNDIKIINHRTPEVEYETVCYLYSDEDKCMVLEII